LLGVFKVRVGVFLDARPSADRPNSKNARRAEC
jgi:hypothetical protein